MERRTVLWDRAPLHCEKDLKVLSLTHKISLPFIPIIFAERNVMSSPLVTIVPWYTPVVRHTVM